MKPYSNEKPNIQKKEKVALESEVPKKEQLYPKIIH